MENVILIRKAQMSDWEETMAMTWRTFMKFESGDYGVEGVENFRKFISDPMLRRMFLLGTYHLYVATDCEKIVGMVSLRDKNHISLLFVDEAYHKKGLLQLGEYLDQYKLNTGYLVTFDFRKELKEVENIKETVIEVNNKEKNIIEIYC